MNIQGNLDSKARPSLAQDRALIFKNEIEKLELSELKMVLKKLNYLSFQIDPYRIDEMAEEEKNIIEEFDLGSFLENPFAITNMLLKMIDLTESAINKQYQ